MLLKEIGLPASLYGILEGRIKSIFKYQVINIEKKEVNIHVDQVHRCCGGF